MDNRVDSIAVHCKAILDILGESDREGTRETPMRFAKFITNFTSKPEFKFTLFDSEGADEMIIQNGIPLNSICEHHCIPFIGTASVAYIPNGKIVGLSKLARLVYHFASGLQNQERITQQVGAFLSDHPNFHPKAVGVSIQAVHHCMTIRGAKAHGACTTTHYLSGVLKTDPSARAEFFHAVKH